jgi:hypothetical protein
VLGIIFEFLESFSAEKKRDDKWKQTNILNNYNQSIQHLILPLTMHTLDKKFEQQGETITT